MGGDTSAILSAIETFCRVEVKTENSFYAFDQLEFNEVTSTLVSLSVYREEFEASLNITNLIGSRRKWIYKAKGFLLQASPNSDQAIQLLRSCQTKEDVEKLYEEGISKSQSTAVIQFVGGVLVDTPPSLSIPE
jgi:hypothetical protein